MSLRTRMRTAERCVCVCVHVYECIDCALPNPQTTQAALNGVCVYVCVVCVRACSCSCASGVCVENTEVAAACSSRSSLWNDDVRTHVSRGECFALSVSGAESGVLCRGVTCFRFAQGTRRVPTC